MPRALQQALEWLDIWIALRVEPSALGVANRSRCRASKSRRELTLLAESGPFDFGLSGCFRDIWNISASRERNRLVDRGHGRRGVAC